MEICWYLNHSETPNVSAQKDNHPFYAIKSIKAGDEVVIDYNELNEPDHLKEAYYKK